MPTYQPPMNPLLSALGMEQPSAESAAGDLTSMMGPIGMMGYAGRLGYTPAQWLRRAVDRARHGKQMMMEITPEALGGATRGVRPASPPNFTPQEVDKMQGVIQQWLEKIPRR